jgi:hypothetical protein
MIEWLATAVWLLLMIVSSAIIFVFYCHILSWAISSAYFQAKLIYHAKLFHAINQSKGETANG